jgi:CRP-like cAMP-binding protein/voltage-gated potassium channel Kch
MEDVYDYVIPAAARASLQMSTWTIVLVTWVCAGWDIIYFKHPDHHGDWQEGGMFENENSFWASFYWTFTTVTTVGYGDICPETIPQTTFALITGAVGAAFCAAIIANVTSFVHNIDVSEDNVEHKRKVVQSFLSDQGINLDLQLRIENYFKYIEQERQGIEEQLFLKNTLPSNLRDDMMLHITSDMVLACEFFAECEPGFVRSVMLSLEQLFYATGNFVLDASPANGMYFIKAGQVELLTFDNKLSNRLGANSSFAEDALINHWEMNPFKAKSTLDSELWFFSRATFNALVFEWPGMKSLLEGMVSKASIKKRRSSLTMTQAELAPILAAARAGNANVFRPNTPILQVWKIFVLAALVYNLLIIPFRIAFAYDHGKYYDNNPHDNPVEEIYNEIKPTDVILDYLCDLILCADVMIRMFFLGFYEEDHFIYEHMMIFKNYRLKEPWILHMLSCVPLELLLFSLDASSLKLSVVQAFSVLRVNKLLRFREVAPITDYLEKAALKRGWNVKKNTLKISKLMIFTFFCSHYFGCTFFFIALMKHLQDRKGSWADGACIMVNNNTNTSDPTICTEGIESSTTTSQYIHSIYWATATLTTVGYGDISASLENMNEIYFNILALIIGTLIYTYIIANLEDIVAQLDVTMTLFKKQVDGVKAYMNQQALDEKLSGHILSYFHYLWEHQSGMNANVILEYMPSTLAKEVRWEIIGHQIKNLFFVKDTHRDFVALFTNELSLCKYMPGDVVFYSGEICNSMYFLFKGSVKLISQTTGVAYTTLSDTVIGEGEFFMRAIQPCTSLAEDHAQAFILTWERFWKLLNSERITNEFKKEYEDNVAALNKKSVSHLIAKLKSNLANAKMQRLMMEKVEEDDVKYWVANPDEAFVRIWNFFALLFTGYYTYIIPFKAAFGGDVLLVELVMLGFVELFFCVDLYFHLQHFAIVKEGQLVRDRKLFRAHYIKNGGFVWDAMSVLPVFFLVYAVSGKGDGEWIWMYNFLQFLRINRLSQYLRNLIDLVEWAGGYRANNGTIRIIEMFLGVLCTAHWMAATFFFIGRLLQEDDQISWLEVNDMNNATAWRYTPEELRGHQYILAFYWAFYTISTTGYGNVGLAHNAERIFAMMCMIVGAIICDAGITAVLTAMIENRDHQAGTNSRRLECAKRYMTQVLMGKADKQNAVLEYFNYEDTELENIDAMEILNKLSEPLKLKVITRHCEEILLASEVIGKRFSRGVVCTIMRSITPQIAIPEELIIDMNSQEDHFFILHEGRAKKLDDVEGKGALQSGAIISNMEEEARVQMHGLPKCSLRTVIHSARNLPKTDLFGACDPYIEIR